MGKWNGVEDCPDCNKPSCTCLHDLTSLEELYSSDTYKGIELPDKLPMCDRQSRMIDGKGKSWCYVHRHSDCCGDNQQSSKYPNVDYSYQACQKPKTQAQAPCRKPCRCSDSPAGGRCEAPYKGEYWCYVDPEACCVEEECMCSPRFCSEWGGGECLCEDERICNTEHGNNTSRTTSVWDFCRNPCNTSTCYIAQSLILGAAGAVSPLSLSSVAGVGFSSLAGQLVTPNTPNGCPLRTISCKCRGDPNRCCAPL